MLRRPVLGLLLLATISFTTALGRQAIVDFDEAYYAEAAREMVESGDWLTPHFNYEFRWEKPVLYYWLTAATYLVTGPTEGAARVWSALSGIGLVLLTWRLARQLSSGRRAAWLAGAIVATNYGYFYEARSALPDLPLAFCITLTISAVFSAAAPADEHPVGRRDAWWGLAGLAAGLGFLTKGPIAVVVPALVLLPIWWRERRAISVSARGVGLALLVAAVIALPWYAAMVAEHGRAYLQSFFVRDNFERFATTEFNDPRPIWWYLPILALGLMPWSVYLLLFAGSGAVTWARHAWRPTAAEWRLLAWVVVPLLFFTVSIGKQPRYILPLLPPMAILLARAISHRIDDGDAAERSGAGGLETSRHRGETTRRRTAAAAPHAAARTQAAMGAATWITALLLIVLAVLLVRAQPVFVSAATGVAWVAAAALVAGALLLVAVASTRRWQQLPPVMILASLVLLLGVQFGAVAGRRPEPVEQMASLVRANRAATEPVASYRVFVRNLVFYTGLKQVRLDDDAAAVRFMQSPERVLLAIGADDLERLQGMTGVAMREVGRVAYLNAADLKPEAVLTPTPERDVKTILLVTNRQPEAAADVAPRGASGPLDGVE